MFILSYIIKNYKKIYIFPFWLILFLVSFIYRVIIVLNRKKGYQYECKKVFIIAVGNITVGGTGKTEVAAYLCSLLNKKKKIALLLRGYKGKGKQPQFVKNNSNTALVGDEAVMLAGRISCPVIVAKKRRLGVQLALKNNTDIIVLDDAFQHWDLKRNLNIILIDYSHSFGNGCLIPAGILREPLSALRDADAILVTKYNKNLGRYSLEGLKKVLRKYNFRCPVFISEYKLKYVTYKNKPVSLNKLKHKRLLVLSGIGNPEYFVLLVKENLKPSRLDVLQYRDHYFYTQKDIQFIRKKLSFGFDYIITTEKDFIKLKSFNFFPMVFHIELKIHYEKKFKQFIIKKINKKYATESRRHREL